MINLILLYKFLISPEVNKHCDNGNLESDIPNIGVNLPGSWSN